MAITFEIPKNIYSAISDYDVNKVKTTPKRPPHQRGEALTKLKKPKNFGIPKKLVPEYILSEKEQEEIVKKIHDEISDKILAKRTQIHTIFNKDLAVGVIGFNGNFWYSFWISPDPKKYLYGVSFYCRNMKSYISSRSVRNFFWNFNIPEEHLESSNKLIYFSKEITEKSFYEVNLEYIPIKNYDYYFSYLFRNSLLKVIKNNILIWKSDINSCIMREILSRSKYKLKDIIHSVYYRDNDWLMKFSQSVKEKSTIEVGDFISKLPSDFKEKMNTNFLRKYIHDGLIHLDEVFKDPNTPNPQYVMNAWKSVYLPVLRAVNIFKIYPNTTIDELQSVICFNLINSRRGIEEHFLTYNYNYDYSDWLNKNVPFKSFLNMAKNDYQMLNDTLSMISDIIRKKPDFKYQGRFRVREFHDYIMTEHWKSNNVDSPLPQHLLPKPIKVEDGWSFFQPSSTHQLAQWGRAARNCVGNSFYCDGIKRKQHFIVLALEKGVPMFTIQLKVYNNTLQVTQILKSCNTELTTVEQNKYQQLFSKALKIREKEIAAELVEDENKTKKEENNPNA